jgi:hypothetical protein
MPVCMCGVSGKAVGCTSDRDHQEEPAEADHAGRPDRPFLNDLKRELKA